MSHSVVFLVNIIVVVVYVFNLYYVSEASNKNINISKMNPSLKDC